MDDPYLAVRAHDAEVAVVWLAGAEGGPPRRPCRRPFVGVDALQGDLRRHGAERGEAVDAEVLLRPAQPPGGEVKLPAPDAGQPLRFGQLQLSARQRLL